MEIFYILTKYVQSHLLQNCRMRERVKWKNNYGKELKTLWLKEELLFFFSKSVCCRGIRKGLYVEKGLPFPILCRCIDMLTADNFWNILRNLLLSEWFQHNAFFYRNVFVDVSKVVNMLLTSWKKDIFLN